MDGFNLPVTSWDTVHTLMTMTRSWSCRWHLTSVEYSVAIPIVDTIFEECTRLAFLHFLWEFGHRPGSCGMCPSSGWLNLKPKLEGDLHIDT